MSLLAIVWVACLLIAAIAGLIVRSPARAFAIGATASFSVVYLALLYVGHPVAGVSLGDVVFAALATAAAVAALRVALLRAKQ
jgi:hypothetical protein